MQPSDGMILVIGPRLESHSVIFLAIQTHPSCRFLLAVDFRPPPDIFAGMHKTIEIFLTIVREAFPSRAALHTEMLALRQQVAVLKREPVCLARRIGRALSA